MLDAVAANSFYKESDVDKEWQRRSVATPINGKKVVAFLQNPWFPEETNPRTIELYKRHMAFRRSVLSLTRTGKWLLRTMTPEIYWAVWWDNANPQHGKTYDHEETGSPEHMESVIKLVDPDIIILFGRQARDTYSQITCHHKSFVMWAPHPMARGNTIPALTAMATSLKESLGC